VVANQRTEIVNDGFNVIKTMQEQEREIETDYDQVAEYPRDWKTLRTWNDVQFFLSKWKHRQYVYEQCSEPNVKSYSKPDPYWAWLGIRKYYRNIVGN
jgi:hypothetical protein